MFDPAIFDHDIFETMIVKLRGFLKVLSTLNARISIQPTVETDVETVNDLTGRIEISDTLRAKISVEEN